MPGRATQLCSKMPSRVCRRAEGYFGLVVGVNRFSNKEALLRMVLIIVVDNFSKLDLLDQEIRDEFFSFQGTPIFPDNVDEILKNSGTKSPLFSGL
jgi:hypothetical protein